MTLQILSTLNNLKWHVVISVTFDSSMILNILKIQRHIKFDTHNFVISTDVKYTKLNDNFRIAITFFYNPPTISGGVSVSSANIIKPFSK